MSWTTVDTSAGPVSVERVGSGPDLVALHSLLSDRHVFDPIVPALSESWTVHLVDLPGFGDTPRVEPGIERYADVVGALFEAQDLDPATTSVLGNGLGAFVALGTAVRFGDRFDRLVLAGCGAWFPEPAKDGFRTMIDRVSNGGMDAVLDVAVARIFTEDYLAAHPDVGEERRAVLRRTDPEAFTVACRSLIDLDLRDGASSIRNPTLVVTGSDDAATPPALGRDLADRIPAASYVELPGVAHAPQLQDPGGFLEVIAPFLEGGRARS